VNAESFLSSVVEAAVGIAGFAGIVAAIRNREIATWPQDEKLLLRMLLIAAGMAATFALLPALLTEAGVPEATIWRLGSLALFAWQAAIAVRRVRQFRSYGNPNPLPRVFAVWVALYTAAQIPNVVLAAAWPYMLGVFGILVNSFGFFMVLLLGDIRARMSASGS